MSKYNSSAFKFFCSFLAVVSFVTIYIYFVLTKNSYNYVEAVKISNGENQSPCVIVIDAGHGGIDSGAVSLSGIMEKDINLKISEYLQALCNLSDKITVMTRYDDELLTPKFKGTLNFKRADLLARTETVSEYDNPVFVSIHQNKFESSLCSGLQVFYSKNNPESLLLADIIRETNRVLLSFENKREIKPAGSEIYVLDNVDCPAVLIECGFLSNASEAEKLNSEDYQRKIAFMIYSSVMKFLMDTGR